MILNYTRLLSTSLIREKIAFPIIWNQTYKIAMTDTYEVFGYFYIILLLLTI